jgi:cytochrome b subunit of formate dehydrogenase
LEWRFRCHLYFPVIGNSLLFNFPRVFHLFSTCHVLFALFTSLFLLAKEFIWALGFCCFMGYVCFLNCRLVSLAMYNWVCSLGFVTLIRHLWQKKIIDKSKILSWRKNFTSVTAQCDPLERSFPSSNNKQTSSHTIATVTRIQLPRP